MQFDTLCILSLNLGFDERSIGYFCVARFIACIASTDFVIDHERIMKSEALILITNEVVYLIVSTAILTIKSLAVS